MNKFLGRRGVKKTRRRVKNRFNVLKPLFVSAEQLDVFLSPQLPLKRLRVNHRNCPDISELIINLNYIISYQVIKDAVLEKGNRKISVFNIFFSVLKMFCKYFIYLFY